MAGMRFPHSRAVYRLPDTAVPEGAHLVVILRHLCEMKKLSSQPDGRGVSERVAGELRKLAIFPDLGNLHDAEHRDGLVRRIRDPGCFAGCLIAATNVRRSLLPRLGDENADVLASSLEACCRCILDTVLVAAGAGSPANADIAEQCLRAYPGYQPECGVVLLRLPEADCRDVGALLLEGFQRAKGDRRANAGGLLLKGVPLAGLPDWHEHPFDDALDAGGRRQAPQKLNTAILTQANLDAIAKAEAKAKAPDARLRALGRLLQDVRAVAARLGCRLLRINVLNQTASTLAAFGPHVDASLNDADSDDSRTAFTVVLRLPVDGDDSEPAMRVMGFADVPQRGACASLFAATMSHETRQPGGLKIAFFLGIDKSATDLHLPVFPQAVQMGAAWCKSGRRAPVVSRLLEFTEATQEPLAHLRAAEAHLEGSPALAGVLEAVRRASMYRIAGLFEEGTADRRPWAYTPAPAVGELPWLEDFYGAHVAQLTVPALRAALDLDEGRWDDARALESLSQTLQQRAAIEQARLRTIPNLEFRDVRADGACFWWAILACLRICQHDQCSSPPTRQDRLLVVALMQEVRDSLQNDVDLCWDYHAGEHRFVKARGAASKKRGRASRVTVASRASSQLQHLIATQLTKIPKPCGALAADNYASTSLLPAVCRIFQANFVVFSSYPGGAVQAEAFFCGGTPSPAVAGDAAARFDGMPSWASTDVLTHAASEHGTVAQALAVSRASSTPLYFLRSTGDHFEAIVPASMSPLRAPVRAFLKRAAGRQAQLQRMVDACAVGDLVDPSDDDYG